MSHTGVTATAKALLCKYYRFPPSIISSTTTGWQLGYYFPVVCVFLKTMRTGVMCPQDILPVTDTDTDNEVATKMGLAQIGLKSDLKRESLA